MATEAQIVANRTNAQQSTGPKTDAGKAKSARNALKHGFRAQIIIDHVATVEHERPEPFASLLADLVAELRPVGPLEEFCVETLAVSVWRLRRVVGEENNLIDELHVEAEQTRELEARNRAIVAAGGPDPGPIIYMFLPKAERLQPLLRYEAHLSRERRHALRELRSLQAIRLASASCPPCSDPNSMAGTAAECKLPNKANSAAGQPTASPILQLEPPSAPSPAAGSDRLPIEANEPPSPPRSEMPNQPIHPGTPIASHAVPNKPNRAQLIRAAQLAVLGRRAPSSHYHQSKRPR